jgi:hypothetical protein
MSWEFPWENLKVLWRWGRVEGQQANRSLIKTTKIQPVRQVLFRQSFRLSVSRYSIIQELTYCRHNSHNSTLHNVACYLARECYKHKTISICHINNVEGTYYYIL